MASLLAGLSQRFHLKIPYTGRNPGQGKGLPRDAYHLRRENIFVAFMVLWGATGQQRQDATNRDDRHLPAHHDASGGSWPRRPSIETSKQSAMRDTSRKVKFFRPRSLFESACSLNPASSASSRCVICFARNSRLTSLAIVRCSLITKLTVDYLSTSKLR